MTLETHIEEDAIRRIKIIERKLEELILICAEILEEVRPTYRAPTGFTVTPL